MPLPAAPKKMGDKLKSLPEEIDLDAPLAAEAAPAARRTKAAAPKKTAKTAAPKTPRAKKTAEAAVPAKPKASRRTAAKIEAAAETVSTAPAPAAAPQPASEPAAKAEQGGVRKLYVLDTNVLLHDPTSLFRFEEHDVYLPMITLEELDNHKSGMTDVARNARQVSRTLDSIMSFLKGADITEGVPLNVLGNKECGGRLFVQTEPFSETLDVLPAGKADNQILTVVRGLVKERAPQPVILVSKDINMRLKATALKLKAEDYYNDKMIEDTDVLYSGSVRLPDNFWQMHANGLKSWQQDGYSWYDITGEDARNYLVNEFVWIEDGGTPFYGEVKAVKGDTASIRVIKDYFNPKNSVWGITARNREQAFALSLLMDPEIDFVTLLGQAGTGKTLLTLAAALTQTMEQRRFNEIIVTRATISVGEDIGFLPGTEEEKMTPWLGAIDDNLEVLNRGDGSASEWSRRASNDLIRSRIRIKSMSFMRGRTFMNKFVIIDEAQNLTPKQMKTLITRAGPGTKIVCLGNIAQIDTPYLTEGSSGLTYVVDRFKGWAHAGHITMQRGERSRLADFASEVL
jgi:PhoH-like ATPase